MAIKLDDMNVSTEKESVDTNVSLKKIPVTVGIGSKIFEVVLWLLGIIPGLIFLLMKNEAQNYFNQLQQTIQKNASQIDNYLEQRVIVLKNCARLLNIAVDLDKNVFESIAKIRAGSSDNTDVVLNDVGQRLDSISKDIGLTVENYPNLAAHNEIELAMQQNLYLQKEITAARELYNDSIYAWNHDIFAWPTKKIVAAKNGYTTRIPYATSQEIRREAKEVLF